MIKDYLKTTIIDKIVKVDLPERFKNVDRELLFKLIEIFYLNPGMIIEYDEISKSLRISKKTLLKHIWLLEFSYLIRKVFNFRPSIMARTRKLQKIYAYWWNLLYCYTENKDQIAENFVASLIDAKYYWRKNREIDFLKVNKKILPVEVKNKSSLTKRDLENLKYFIKKFGIKESLVVYDGTEKEVKVEKRKIKLIPFWKFGLII